MLALPFPMWPSLMSTRMRDDFGSRREGLPAKRHGKLNTHLHIFLCGLTGGGDIGLDGTAQQSCSTQCAEGQRAWLH